MIYYESKNISKKEESQLQNSQTEGTFVCDQ
jgi:hypothetical protein